MKNPNNPDELWNFLKEYKGDTRPEGWDLDVVDEKGNTLLLICTRGGDDLSTIVNRLLKMGANPNFMSREFQTPLINAVFYSNKNIEPLLKAGADPNVNIQNSGMIRPLIIDTCLHCPSYMELLLSYGATKSMNFESENFNNILQLTCFSNPEYISMLLNFGVSLENTKGIHILDVFKNIKETRPKIDYRNLDQSIQIINNYFENKVIQKDIKIKISPKELSSPKPIL